MVQLNSVIGGVIVHCKRVFYGLDVQPGSMRARLVAEEVLWVGTKRIVYP
jgi:hypothetical protein